MTWNDLLERLQELNSEQLDAEAKIYLGFEMELHSLKTFKMDIGKEQGGVLNDGCPYLEMW